MRRFDHPVTGLISYVQWRRKRYGGLHTSLKFGMAAPYQSAENLAVDF